MIEVSRQIWMYYQRLLEYYKRYPCASIRDEIELAREELAMRDEFAIEIRKGRKVR